MLAQGSRRLYECIVLSKPSSSQMWVGHWLLGILFYLAINIATFMEGIPTLQQEPPTISHLRIVAPTFRTIACVPIFLMASGTQYDCHVYLASLKKYTLPQHPAFQSIVCPHYLAECVIYLALALIAAPQGHWINGTIFSALCFVVVNLGVTAKGTKEWEAEKFGLGNVKGKWRMVPFLW
ncbi:hypothetical protein LTR66_004139 [Elasticomyces elasticus]|nr:hypothetical protein LTR66_004139 [Elasticomyces elasticus]